MATVVRMPAALAGETEGAIQSWLAEVGQTVAVGEPLAEIETEKAVVEYAAEVPGTLARLLAEPGRNIAVGEPIAVILAPGEDESALDAALSSAGLSTASEPGSGGGTPAPGTAPDPTVTEVPAAPEPETAPPTEDEPADAPDTAANAPDTAANAPDTAANAPDTAANAQPGSSSSGGGDGRRFASPIVRRLARERSIALDDVVGSGPGGRIVRRDLDRLPERTAEPSARPATEAAPSSPAAAPAAASEPSAAGYTDIPLTGMRKAIARRLTESKSTVPHFYLTADCRVDRLLELRRSVNETAERKISVNDFVLKAVAGALVRVPQANAIWNGDSIRQFDSVDIAVAVSVPNGLLTPVLRGVESLSLTAISARVADLAERARAGRLKQPELEGGSFSVSNLGMYGVDEFSAILNPPQAGILAVGAAKQRPVVEDGALAVGSVMTVTLSADHRVIDGAVGAEWMAAFVKLVENPLSMLI